jgi:FKBP-type peptidyl-prolyl cis-trans isomerase FkpA
MSNKFFKSLFAVALAVLLISATSCDPSKKYEDDEKNAITSYLFENSTLNYDLKPSGLYFLEVKAGEGALAETHDTAYVIYKGMFLDGTAFDTNVGKDTLIFPVNEGWMIPGFDESITYMKPGGKAQVLIPSKLAYGPSGYYMIGGYTPLLYDIELARLVRSAK